MKSRSPYASLFGAVFLLVSLLFVWWSNSNMEVRKLSQNKLTAVLAVESYENGTLSGTITYSGDGAAEVADLTADQFPAKLTLPGEDEPQELTYTDTQLTRRWGEQTLVCSFQAQIPATEDRLSIQVEGFDSHLRFFLPTAEAEESAA